MDISYKHTAFIILKAPSKVISTHLPKSKKEHAKLLERAKSGGYYLYYAVAESRNGKYFATQPWQLDWDSVVDEPEEVKPESEPETSELACPFCDKVCNSKPGRTLHVKSRHPNHVEEYRKWLTGKK